MRETSLENQTKMYACPMHPEVQGKLNDKCPKVNKGLNYGEYIKITDYIIVAEVCSEAAFGACEATN